MKIRPCMKQRCISFNPLPQPELGKMAAVYFWASLSGSFNPLPQPELGKILDTVGIPDEVK